MFFHRLAALVSWCTTNLMVVNLMVYSLRFKKDALILKMLRCFCFSVFGFAVIPHPSYYFASIVDKTHHGPVNAPFYFRSFFRYGRGVLVSK